MIVFPNVTLVQIRSFCAVAEHGQFTVAASRLSLSQSAVSQAVAGLEKALDAQLLIRRRDGVTLSAAGVVALAEAKAVLALVERLAASVRLPSALQGDLRIGVVQSAAIRLLPGWMRRLRATHPAVNLTLYEGTDPEVTGWVKAGIVDVGFTSRTERGLHQVPVFEDDYVVVLPAGHALASSASLRLKDLDGHRMLMSGGGCETLIEELLAAASSRPDIVCLVRDNAALVSMVAEGLGLTIMPELAVPQHPDNIVLLRLRPNLRRTLHAVTMPATQQRPTVTALLDLVRRTPPEWPQRKVRKKAHIV
ncbi:MAG: LysR family transcriptional regulator [Hyphomicrobiaceae bacterium]|nr:LysR family transcriptional regulator [Hyphomicrobiaceae bacterium]